MKKPNKYCLVGAGGIGCAVAQFLASDADLLICDADNYEPANHGRQFPSLRSTENKAKVLSEIIAGQTFHTVSYRPEYAKSLTMINWPEWEGVDFIIGAVDNNPSRRALASIGDQLGIPVILAGNEHEHGEAHLMIPELYNPFWHHDFPKGDPAPWACNATKTLETHPQTHLANIMAAAAVMHILLSWRTATRKENVIVYSRLDPFSSICVRAKNALADKPQPE